MSRCILVESCAMCPHLGEHQQCWANGQRSTMLPGVSSIPDWCPLPEAPDHFRELDELIDEARALHWQPLETAPKDGTKILVSEHEDGRDSVIRWWHEDMDEWFETFYGTDNRPGGYWHPLP